MLSDSYFLPKNSMEMETGMAGGPIKGNDHDLFSSSISDHHHQAIMEELTFSFADSNKSSIVLEEEGMFSHSGAHHERGVSIFVNRTPSQKRISLTNPNVMHTLTAGMHRNASGTILSNSQAMGRDRAMTTGLDAFSRGGRAKRGNTLSFHPQIGGMDQRQRSGGSMGGSSSGGNGGDDEDSAKKRRKHRKKRRKQLNLIHPSPYHVTKLYKPVIHFVENAEWKIMGLYGDTAQLIDATSSVRLKRPDRRQIEEFHAKRKLEAVADECDLREYLKDFVKNQFVPNINAEARMQMSQILVDNQPMDSIRIPDEALLFLKSTSGIFDLIKTLFEYYVVLPSFGGEEFTAMVQAILSKFQERYKQEIDDIVEQEMISIDLIQSRNRYIDQLDAYELSKIFSSISSKGGLGGGGDDEFSSRTNNYRDDTASDEPKLKKFDGKNVDKLSFEYISEMRTDVDMLHFLNLENEDKINKSAGGVPQFNTDDFRKLALCSSGLFWMSKKITSELITPLTHHHRRRRGSYSSTSMTNHSSLSRLSQNLAQEFEPLSEHCISIIRMEMRSQAVCLLKNISAHNYWMPDDSIINKPQDFIISLNKHLVSCESKLNNCLPEPFIRFLFVELAYFICEVIIYQIPLVQNGKINHVGYKQLYKNTFSLQQNLTNITSSNVAQKGMEKCFDRAQKYLKLSQKTPSDIERIQLIKNKKHATGQAEKFAAYDFTKDQYEAISTVAKLSNAHRK